MIAAALLLYAVVLAVMPGHRWLRASSELPWPPTAIRRGLRGPGPRVDASLVVVCALIMRVLLRAAHRLRRTRRERAHVSAAVAALAPTRLTGPYQDVSVVTLPEPTAFCNPGRHPQIVISRSALRRLSEDQAGAVVSHERAHLRYRHAAWASWAALLGDAFPRWPLVAAYARAVPRLHEMQADDLAARATGGRVVTASLLALAAPPVRRAGHGRRRRGDPGRPAAGATPTGTGTLTGVGVVLGLVLMIPLVVFTGPGHQRGVLRTPL